MTRNAIAAEAADLAGLPVRVEADAQVATATLVVVGRETAFFDAADPESRDELRKLVEALQARLDVPLPVDE